MLHLGHTLKPLHVYRHQIQIIAVNCSKMWISAHLGNINYTGFNYVVPIIT